MSACTEVRVPDIGDFKNVPIIQILVAPGDVIKVDDRIVTLENPRRRRSTCQRPPLVTCES